ncbi:thioredoxin family protein [Streptomyces sp. CA-146814]|uniref:thioredoxin family protein n=1 Tax=Streptomyces sp. CA-146814 TaxID=3240053 RepID=UPI003D8D8BCA
MQKCCGFRRWKETVMITITGKEQFNKLLGENPQVVAYFTAVWCGPCKVITPVLTEMSKEYGNVTFLKVDVDDHEDLAAEYKIEAMPTFVFLQERVVKEKFSGASEVKLRDNVQKLFGS